MGYGHGFGSTPWGGFLLPAVAPGEEEPPDGFDIFCFFDVESSMGQILTNEQVQVGAWGNAAVGPDDTLSLVSGLPAEGTLIFQVIESVPQTWTLQVVVTFTHLPADFSDLVSAHAFLGATDAAGPAAGLFFSLAGVAFAGAINHDGEGNLLLEGPYQPLPGVSGLIQEGVEYTIRLAADNVTGATYVFVTPTADVPLSGHVLRAILPVVGPADLANPATDRVVLSMRGTTTRTTRAVVRQLCLGAGLVMPNLPPRAEVGRDQAARLCSVIQLDGSASFDPEESPLAYSWRLIDAPLSSQFSLELADGRTFPGTPATGFADRLYSDELGEAAALDPIEVGDVLLVGGQAYSIIATGTGVEGFFARVSSDVLPDSLNGAAFKVLRQRGITGLTDVKPTFLPDVTGIYRFDLTVSDGQLLSTPAVTVVNVLDSPVPRGCVPDLTFMWGYLSDFWRLVEGRERIQVVWEGMAQVVASELLALWQIDYAKSLRDVQRTFQRRWLHYDLKLAEPMPEFTQVRQIYGGVSSEVISAGGISGVQGTQLVVVTPDGRSSVVPFEYDDPYTAEHLRELIATKLHRLDRRFTVRIIPEEGGDSTLRIEAPCAFRVDDASTLGIFAPGARNQHPCGTGGIRVGTRAYRVDRSLEGLEFQEGDLLVVGESAYRILRTVDDAADPYRFQRVIVQRDLPLSPGATWAIPGVAQSRFLNFYAGLVTRGDTAYFEIVGEGEATLAAVPVEAPSQSEAGKLGVNVDAIAHFIEDPAYDVRLAKVVRRARLPLSPLVVDVPVLQELIVEQDESRLLRRNVDYYIEEFRGTNSIRFVCGQPGDVGDVWEGEPPPDRLWAEITYLDNRPTIEANFGIAAQFTLDDLAQIDVDLDYLSAVRGLWFAYLKGPTLFNLRAGVQILLGLPFAEEESVVEEVRADFSPTQGRILLRDVSNTAIVRSYAFPAALQLEVNPTTGERYKVGDRVRQFAPLVEGAEIMDYVKDPRWFEGLLSQGAFFEVEKFHKFMVRVDSSAFTLSSLAFAQSFVRRVKPTYVLPKFAVARRLTDTEVSVTDQIGLKARLLFHDGPCMDALGVAGMFDQYRPAGGGVRNQFDRGVDPADPPPTFPTADSPIAWGYDRHYLCPESEVEFLMLLTHEGGEISTSSEFPDGAQVLPAHRFVDEDVDEVLSAGYVLSASPQAVAVGGTVEQVRYRILGGPGEDPADYELVVEVDSVEVSSTPVTVAGWGASGEVSVSLPVLEGEGLSVRIRPASGGDRAPDWSAVEVTLFQDAIAWEHETVLPAGVYCSQQVSGPDM